VPSVGRLQTARGVTGRSYRLKDRATQDNRRFKGLIDDVRIYNYALSEMEIMALCEGNEPSSKDGVHEGKNIIP
jgi:hypothetical protein